MAANLLPIIAIGAAAFLLMRKNGNGAPGASGVQGATYDPEKDDPWFQHLNAQIAEHNANWFPISLNQKRVVLEAGVVTTTTNGRCYWALTEDVELVPGKGLVKDILKFHAYAVCPSGQTFDTEARATGPKALQAMFARMQSPN